MTSAKQMVATLFIVALVCAVVLSFVYAFTSPRIIETQKRLTIQGLKEAIDAYEFVEIIPDTLWQAVDSLNNFIGIAFRVFPQGYGGPIPITVGLNLDEKITGIRIASAAEGLKETPGLGVKITEPDFIEQFTGKCITTVALKKDGGEIDAITAATISSRAVCNGVKKGIDTYLDYLGSSIDKKCVFPDAQEFVEVIKDTLWYALSGSDTIGIVFIGVTKGFIDYIKFIVGINSNKKIIGVDILHSTETAGIGDVIKKKGFLDRFKEGTPDIISGATISCQCMIDGVESGLERFKEYLK